MAEIRRRNRGELALFGVFSGRKELLPMDAASASRFIRTITSTWASQVTT
jgi:hypothetical protein